MLVNALLDITVALPWGLTSTFSKFHSSAELISHENINPVSL
jgi:hypothetical protein